MSASDVLAVVAATLVAVLSGALVVTLLLVARALRQLRQTVELLREDALALLDETHAIVREAARDVERVDALVSSAEKLNDAVDGAQRIAYKTLASPVVKAMALRTGVSRAAQKLREPDPPATAVARAKARRKRRTA